MFKRNGITYSCGMEYELIGKIQHEIDHPSKFKHHHDKLSSKKVNTPRKPKTLVWKKMS